MIRAALIIGALLVVGALDYQDDLDEAEHYREMVCAGAWPDYRWTNPDCSNESEPEN